MASLKMYYQNDSEYLYDNNIDNPLFDIQDFSNVGKDYLMIMEMYKNKPSEDFSYYTYDYLNSEQKTGYLADLMSLGDYSKYSRDDALLYYKEISQQNRDEASWNSMSFWDKLGSTIGTVVLNVFTEAYGVVEGIIDLGATIVQAVSGEALDLSEFIAGDTTGVGALRDMVESNVSTNYWLNDKSKFGKYLFGATGSIARMWTLAVPGVGQAMYYGSLFGQSTESAYQTLGTDTSVYEIALYSGIQTGFEYLGEKLIGDAFFGKGFINLDWLKSKGFIAHTLTSIFSEGTEEAVTEILNYAGNAAMDALFDNDYSQFQPDNLGQAVLDSFITGGLMGGLMIGGRIAVTPKVKLPNGKVLSRSNSVLWTTDIAKDLSEITNTSELTKLKERLGTLDPESSEYKAALNKDLKTANTAIKSLKSMKLLSDALGADLFEKSVVKSVEDFKKAQNSLRNYWLQYSLGETEYKELIKNTTEKHNQLANSYNSKHPENKLTVVYNNSDEFAALKNAFKNSGKEIIPVKMGNENGRRLGDFIVDYNNDAIFVDVDSLESSKISDILQKAMLVTVVQTFSKNPSIINNPDIKSLFSKKYGETFTEQEKIEISARLLSDPRTISAIIGTNKSLTRLIYKNIKQQSTLINTKEKANKIKYKELVKALNLYKLQLCINAGSEEALVYVSEYYDIPLEELQEIFNKLTLTNFQEHYVSEKLNVSQTSQETIDGLLFLNNSRIVEEIQNNPEPTDLEYYLNENIYKSDFIDLVNKESQYKNFALNLNKYLVRNYGIFINPVSNTFESNVNLFREVSGKFRTKMDKYIGELNNFKNSELSNEEFEKSFDKLLEDLNNENFKISNIFNESYINRIGLKNDAKIVFEKSLENYDLEGKFNPTSEGLITIYINPYDYSPNTPSIKDLNDIAGISSSIYNTIFHESIHSIMFSENGYYGTSQKAILNFLNSEKGKSASEQLRKVLDTNLDNQKISSLVYMFTFGELEANRYKGARNKELNDFLYSLGYSIETGTATLKDGFISTKTGLMGVGKFRNIIISLNTNIAESKNVSFENLSEEGVNKLSFDNTNELNDTRLDDVDVVKEAINKFQENKSKENFIEIGRLADDLNVDLKELGFNYNWDLYDKLTKTETKETAKKDPQELLEKRISAIKKAKESGDSENLSRLENLYKVTKKESLIEELGEENYKKLISEFKSETISTKSALNQQARDLKVYLNNNYDKLSEENKKVYDDIKNNWSNKSTATMSEEDVRKRLETLLSLKNSIKKETKKPKRTVIKTENGTEWSFVEVKEDEYSKELKKIVSDNSKIGMKTKVFKGDFYVNGKVFSPGTDIAGFYDITSNTIYLNSEDSDLEKTNAHEQIHRMLRSLNNKYSYYINNLYNQIKNLLNEQELEYINNALIKEFGLTKKEVDSENDYYKEEFISHIFGGQIITSYENPDIMNALINSLYNDFNDISNTSEKIERNSFAKFLERDTKEFSNDIVEEPVKLMKEQSEEAFSEKTQEKTPENSAMRAIFDDQNELSLVEKNNKIIEDLKDTTYRTDKNSQYYKSTKSEAIGSEGEIRDVISYNIFIEKNSLALSQIDSSNFDYILDAMLKDDVNSVNRTMFLNWAFDYGYNLTKEQFKRLNKVRGENVSRIGAELKTVKDSLMTQLPISTLATAIKKDYNHTLDVPRELLDKHCPEYKGKSFEELFEETSKKIEKLQNKINKETDPYAKYLLEEESKQMKEEAGYLKREDLLGLLENKYKRLMDRIEIDGKLDGSAIEIVEDIVKLASEQTKNKHKVLEEQSKGILTPKKREKLLDLLSKIETLRYMAMLSSFSTYARNHLVNVGSAINNIMTNVTGKGIEKLIKSPESQVSYYGEVTKEFSDYIDNKLKEEIDLLSGGGNKYDSGSEGNIKLQYALEKGKFEKFTFLNKIQKFQRKMLSDKFYVRRQLSINIKKMLSGARYQLLSDIFSRLRSRYNVRIIDGNLNQANEKLLEKLKTSNKDLYNKLNKALSGDMIEITELSTILKLPLIDSIINKAMYRANDTYFKNDNILSRALSNLRKTHPVFAGFISATQPFLKIQYNLLQYTFDHSPIGIAKGIFKLLQAKNTWINDKHRAILSYYKENYFKDINSTDFDESEFNKWLKENADPEVYDAINWNKTSINNVFNKMVENGIFQSSLVGAENPFAKADAVELLAKGAVGTANLTLGIIFALLGYLEIDKDDYMGLVLKIGDWKIRLSDISPVSTPFSAGAALIASEEGTFGGKLKDSLAIFYDQTMIGNFESMIQYNYSLSTIAEGMFINYIQQYIPSLWRNIMRVVDPSTKIKSGDFFEKLWKTTLSNLFPPLVASKIDPYTGEPITRFSTGSIGEFIHLFNPLQIRFDNDSDLEKEAKRLGVETSGARGSFKINDKDYSFTSYELQSLQLKRAEFVNNELTKLMNSNKYKSMSDEEKRKAFSSIYSRATEVMKIDWWTKDPNRKYYFTTYEAYSNYIKYMTNKKNVIYFKNYKGDSKYFEK